MFKQKPVISRHPNGDIKLKRWYNKNGKLHRDDGPALIRYKNNKILYKKWYKNGKLHKENGPAYIDMVNSHTVWFNKGQIHRLNAPAHVYTACFGYVICKWHINGKLHRLDGPAIIHKTRRYNDEWFVNGRRIKDKSILIEKYTEIIATSTDNYLLADLIPSIVSYLL